MAINIYPPLVNSSQPAFLYNQDAYSIYFTLPDIVRYDDINHVQVRIVYQSNNKSIVNTNLYPDGVIYKPVDSMFRSSFSDKVWFVNIMRGSDLARTDTWKPDTYYKVQVRFGTDTLWNNLNEFTSWKNRQITNRAFSEWSTVMVIKAISAPTVSIINNEIEYVGDMSDVSTLKTETTVSPIFFGRYENMMSSEIVQYYRFKLFEGDTPTDEFLMEDSGWLLHDSSNDNNSLDNYANSLDNYRFSHILERNGIYSVVYSIQTENGYEVDSPPYYFEVTESYLNRLEGLTLKVIDGVQDNIARENACMFIYLTSEGPISGNYVISRSSEESGYAVWEDLKYFVYSNHTFEDELIFTDYTIESGIRYKYAFQQENSEGLRTMPLYENINLDVAPTRVTDFEYSYLLGAEGQLKLMYDSKMSSFKHTVLESKQDTLGSKYPVVLRNGETYYAEFPITGLISLNMDTDNNSLTFFEKRTDGYYYQGKKIITDDKYTETVYTTTQAHPDGPIANDIESYNHQLSKNNIFIERMFREKVEEFLNNGDYKLFKSATEGNILVTLMNVNLTPNEILGRMIYSFSATAYEILDNTIENLDKFGIIEIGGFNDVIDTEVTLVLGQLSGYYIGQKTRQALTGEIVNENAPQNLIDSIKEQCQTIIGGGYQYKFQRIKSIWIEQYPKIDYIYEMNELEAELATANSKYGENSEQAREIQNKIDVLNQLIDEIESEEEYPLITVIINGQEITLGRNKIYSLREIQIGPADTIYLKYSGAVIINYVVEVISVESASQTVGGVYTVSMWGQIEGAFTETTKILNNYDYYRHKDVPQVNVIYDTYMGRYTILDPKYNLGLVQSLNIVDSIKYQTKMYVEQEFNTEFDTYIDDTGQWTDGKRYYLFEDITVLEIEADEGTRLILGKNDDKDTIEVTIGPTEKYVLKPMDKMVKYIAFESPTYAIVNYKSKATIQVMVGGMDN